MRYVTSAIGRCLEIKYRAKWSRDVQGYHLKDKMMNERWIKGSKEGTGTARTNNMNNKRLYRVVQDLI